MGECGFRIWVPSFWKNWNIFKLLSAGERNSSLVIVGAASLAGKLGQHLKRDFAYFLISCYWNSSLEETNIKGIVNLKTKNDNMGR